MRLIDELPFTAATASQHITAVCGAANCDPLVVYYQAAARDNDLAALRISAVDLFVRLFVYRQNVYIKTRFSDALH